MTSTTVMISFLGKSSPFASVFRLLLLSLLISYCSVHATCKAIMARNPSAASGVYNIKTSYTGNIIEVYCEMGLNGGGYTFLSSKSLNEVTRDDLQDMFTDRTNFLMRVQLERGRQPYSVLTQLPRYSHIPLNFDLNSNALYADPVNKYILSEQYLYFGFLPISEATNNNIQGLAVNGISLTFSNCDKTPNSYFALFPNFAEAEASIYGRGSIGQFCKELFKNSTPNPSARLMPVEYFMFTETHWGGCGCYTTTTTSLDGRLESIIGTAIGFR